MKPTRLISFLRGIIMLDHHCQNCVAPSGRKKQCLTSLADSPSSRSPFPSATASHSWESVQVSGPSGPRAYERTGVEVAEGRPRGGGGGQNCMCALPGPLSQCASAAQTGHCSSSSCPFITTPHPPLPPLSSTPPHPSAGNRRVQGRAGQWLRGGGGGHLLILKI